ncbi:MAG TPA: hypothetical protein VMD91_03745 [Candidatus Sulfotelmatobacter sp.]|nr:hypothetical protein [Candidatus Sulfotelmatobacter sp.]
MHHLRRLAALVVLAAVPLAARAATIEQTVKITTVAPNTLLIDASAGHHVITIPSATRTFPTLAAFVQYCVTAFHGKAINDAKGNLIGVAGVSIIRDHAYSVDPKTHALVEQDDPILAQIAGTTGQVRIGTKVYDLSRPQPPALRTKARRRADPILLAANPPSEVDTCSQGACAKNTSFVTNLFLYYAVGSTTQQTKGGFEQSSSFCWKDGWIPWVCTTSSGSNSLSVSNEYFNFATPIPEGPSSAQARNVTSLTLQIWAFGTVLGVVGDATGVCGSHGGTGIGSSTVTSSGKIGTCF